MAKNKKDKKYTDRENIIRKAYFQKGIKNSSSLQLASLASLMKESSIENKHLSSLYFAGAEGDHPYFLKNDKIAIGISVLPEDAEKAGLSKCHPHQKEVIFVINGIMYLEIIQKKKLKKIKLVQGDVFVVNEGECHRIFPIDNLDATFLFVKTNPAIEPRSKDCSFT